jgi:hypothetical protein
MTVINFEERRMILTELYLGKSELYRAIVGYANVYSSGYRTELIEIL